jgi:hypothetical protein
MAAGRKVRMTGGRGIARELRKISDGMSGSVKVGFLEKSTYPQDYKRDQKRLALVRKVIRKQTTNPVGPAKPSPTLYVAQVAYWDEFGHGATKPRPFFRTTIAENEKTWGAELAAIAKANNYDGPATLASMGTRIKDQLVTKIKQWPADNHPATVEIKGFNKGLIDRGIMQRAVDFEVTK